MKNPAFHPSTDAAVNAILNELCEAVQSILGEQFVGLYLYGSLALGDFDPQKSDIDFLVVTAAELSPAQLAALQAMHRRLAAGSSKWGQELEGSYIPRDALRRYDPAITQHPHIDRGEDLLHIRQHDTDWVVQRYNLREYGLTLAGPDLRSLIDPISPEELRRAVLGLMWWWDLQLSDPRQVATSPYQAYAVLSMCRILYTLQHGTILSKPAAARWALGALEPRWAGLIERALAWQPDQELDRLEETLDFIRYTLAQAYSLEGSMILSNYSTAGQFLAAAQPALEANEAANNLMLGLALRAERHPEHIQFPHYYSAVHLDGQLQAAALMTPPHNVVVFSASEIPPPQAFRLIAEDLRRGAWPLPGVLGPNAAAQAFARAWQTVSGEAHRLDMHERVYELRQVTPAAPTPGQMRPAAPADLEQVAGWLVAFHQEALPDETPPLEEAREIAHQRIEEGSFYLWEVDGRPVALAGWTRPTPHGCCVGPVYTPDEARRKGYATALTAALSQLLLDSGRQFTALFTNLANPISNSVYQKIGYRRVCEFDLYRFAKKAAEGEKYI